MKSATLAPHITVDGKVRFGKPCVAGTRLAVEDVLNLLADGQSSAEIIEDFPELTEADIRACLKFSADQMARTAFGLAA